MHLDIEVPQKVKKYLLDLQQAVQGKYRVMLAGGALRDYYTNRVPKDLDIVFVPLVDDLPEMYDQKGRTTVFQPPALVKTYVNYCRSTIDIPDIRSRGVDVVVGVYNSHLPTTDIQYIVYNKYMSAMDVAEDMDCSINQVVFPAGSQLAICPAAFVQSHTDKVIECVHKFDVLRMHDRYDRMKAKFPDYTEVGRPVLTEEEEHRKWLRSQKAPRASGASSPSFFDEDEEFYEDE